MGLAMSAVEDDPKPDPAKLLDSELCSVLPNEILIKIIGHVFQPWSATIDITCQLQPIAHTRILRTCKLFHEIGTEAIKKSFTGEFIRHDRRGQIRNRDLKPVQWYQWIMQNTITLHMMDASFSLWFIVKYWEYYPLLKTFRITVVPEPIYRNVAAEMPDYLDRCVRCDIKTQTLVGGNYGYHSQVFHELTTAVYDNIVTFGRDGWPSIEYRFNDCRCHPERLTVSMITTQFQV